MPDIVLIERTRISRASMFPGSTLGIAGSLNTCGFGCGDAACGIDARLIENIAGFDAVIGKAVC
jgi:hypothetical protein